MAGRNKGKRKLKSAEGLSLQTIAVAAIILVVIIIVIAVFKGGIGKIVPTLEKVNECKDTADVPPYDGCKQAGECDKAGYVEIYGLGCPEKDSAKPYCCQKK